MINLKNHIHKKAFISAISILFVAVAPTIEAQIYKCENLQHEFFYNDKPCPILDKETILTSVKDPLNVYIPPSSASTKKEVEGGGITTDNRKDNDVKENSDKGENPEISDNNAKTPVNDENMHNNHESPTIIESSSGRKSVLVSGKSSPSSKPVEKYIMKVEESMQEPR